MIKQLLMMFNKNFDVIISVVLLFTVWGCQSKLPMDQSIGKESYSLINQDSAKVVFPNDYKGKILVMGFIYTNCPDICPLTTHNMEVTQNLVKKDKLKNVQFVALTFDPDRDTPSVLKKYGQIRNIDFSNFQFLTGKRALIDTLIHHMDVMAIANDTTYTKNGQPIYFFTHTDRITLLDQNMKIRNEYRGSHADPQKIVNDIKNLE